MLVQRLSQAAGRQISGKRSVHNALYKHFYGKSFAAYCTFIIVGAYVGENLFFQGTEGLWNSANKGKLYKDIDWSKFKVEDEDEE